MSRDDVTTARGIEMDDDGIDELLETLGHGTLSLGSEETVYGIPISFGYDGERLFLSLVRFGDESRKLSMVGESSPACLTVYEAETRYEWQSVVVTGTVEDVEGSEEDYAQAVLDDNGWFPTIYPPTSPMTEVRRMELVIDEATGRNGEAFQ